MRTRVIVLRILGAVFVLSAVLKSLDLTAFAVQISYYGIVREPRIVWAIAVGVIAVESALGMAALLGIAVRRVTLPAPRGADGGMWACASDSMARDKTNLDGERALRNRRFATLFLPSPKRLSWNLRFRVLCGFDGA